MPENAAEKLALAATPTPSTFQRWWRETASAGVGESAKVVMIFAPGMRLTAAVSRRMIGPK
jgi:hypothetical protein